MYYANTLTHKENAAFLVQLILPAGSNSGHHRVADFTVHGPAEHTLLLTLHHQNTKLEIPREKKNKAFNQQIPWVFNASSCSIVQLTYIRGKVRSRAGLSARVPNPAQSRRCCAPDLAHHTSVQHRGCISFEPTGDLQTKSICTASTLSYLNKHHKKKNQVLWIIQLPRAFLREPPGLLHLGAGGPYIIQYVIRSALLCNINMSAPMLVLTNLTTMHVKCLK